MLTIINQLHQLSLPWSPLVQILCLSSCLLSSKFSSQHPCTHHRKELLHYLSQLAHKSTAVRMIWAKQEQPNQILVPDGRKNSDKVQEIPADLPSNGSGPTYQEEHKLYFSGPCWLTKNELPSPWECQTAELITLTSIQTNPLTLNSIYNFLDFQPHSPAQHSSSFFNCSPGRGNIKQRFFPAETISPRAPRLTTQTNQTTPKG